MAKDIAELNRLYTEAESVDSELFAEQRSNILLVSGEHYAKKGSRFWNRIRDTKQLSNEQKIRLTKNHLQKITKTYINNITSQAPGTAILPKNETELQDQKAAELHHAVWQDLKVKQKIKKKTREWVKDYVDIGETFVKVFFDPRGGELKGFEAEVERDEQGNISPDPYGNVVVKRDEQGQMIPSDKAVFTGGIIFERYFAFNVLRHAGAKNMDESPFLCVRKMTPIADLKAMVGDDEEKLKFIQESSQDIYNVFDGQTGSYYATKDQCLVREFYFRPCVEYPKGYYYITTVQGTLFEGELPFGIFPIKYCGFDEIATSPRARSIVKQLRPYQAEINRSASKIAEHQVTLGDDKLLIQSGTKLAHGGTLAGVRGIQYSGMAPGILAGRSGEQYLAYMQSQIREMYEVSNVYEDSEELKANLDPYAMLYRSIRNKKKFSYYAEKFEEFLVEVTEAALDLAKNYYDEGMLIPAIGRREYINIAEFKSQEKLCYQIKVEPQLDDVETKLGKQITMNQIIQYVGKDLGKDAIGRMIRAMPFVNEDEAFNDLTIDHDNSVNDILALDRGEYPPANKYDNHTFMIKRLTHRMKQGDFRFLAPQVQNSYQRKLQEHEQIEAQMQQQILAAQADFIPTGGYLVTCDFYVNDPDDPARTRRARLPYQSVDWLIKRLEDQGSTLQTLEGMQQAALSDMAGMLPNRGGSQAPFPGGGGMQIPPRPQNRGPQGPSPTRSAPPPVNPGVNGEPGLIPSQAGVVASGGY